MAPIQVFVFMDFGCERYNSEIPTEVSLLAVPRSQYYQPNMKAKPQDQITLYFDSVNPQDLKKESNLVSVKYPRNTEAYKEIDEFIRKQEKPVCLVAHNGIEFDFQILKEQLEIYKISLPDDLLCADSLYAFYDILQGNENVDTDNVEYKGRPVREIFYEGHAYPGKGKYTLGAIYDRFVKEPVIEHHPAENDVEMEFRISHKMGEIFLAWTDQIQLNFTDVPERKIKQIQ